MARVTAAFGGRRLTITAGTTDVFWRRETHTAQPFTGPDGRRMYFQCVGCRQWFEHDGCRIGHRADWATWLEWQGITEDTSTWDEAQDAFNDLTNLVVRCPGCYGAPGKEVVERAEW